MNITTEITPDTPVPAVFGKLLEPINEFVQKQDAELPRHHNQKFGYYDFFMLLMYFFVSEGTSFKLFIETKLNKGLLPPSLNLRPVPYSTANEAFERFAVSLFRDAFHHLLKTVPFKCIPELAAFGTLHCIDGSLFPVVNSMLWAEYTSKRQSLKLHLCFELNRMIPAEFLVTAANHGERPALLEMLKSGITYIADRGYMSFDVCHQILEAEAHFIFRVKANLLYSITETLPVELPEKTRALFTNVSDELICYTNDKFKHIYRLISFSVAGEAFHILTDRRDLTTFQVITLYAYRWQIELLFRFLKRTMSGIHLIKHDRRGVTIQFYAMLIVALLQLRLKQITADAGDDGNNAPPANENDTAAAHRDTDTENPILSKPDFFDTIGENLKKYWKIGIHWLTALKSLPAEPFDRRAVEILNSS